MARKEAEGRTRKEALRSLKRHPVGVVFHKLATLVDASREAGAPLLAPADLQ